MKLDRNINPCGRGKYALINLRTNQVQWGGSEGLQFFVMKYKDKFTGPALHAYADAVREEAERTKSDSLLEYAIEMKQQAEMACRQGCRIPD